MPSLRALVELVRAPAVLSVPGDIVAGAAAVGAGIVGLPLLQGALIAGSGAPATGVAVAAGAPLARRLARKVSPT